MYLTTLARTQTDIQSLAGLLPHDEECFSSPAGHRVGFLRVKDMVDRTYQPKRVGLALTACAEFVETSSKTPNIKALKARGADLPVRYYRFSNWKIRSANVLPARPGYAAASLCDAPTGLGYEYLRGARGGLLGSTRASARYVNGNLFGRLSQTLENALDSKLRDETFNLGVLIGEFKETSSLISDACSTIARGWRGLVQTAKDAASRSVQHLREELRRNAARARAGTWIETMRSRGLRAGLRDYQQSRRNQRRALRRQVGRLGDLPLQVRDAWLQWSYAVSPLMGEVQGSIEAIERASERLARQHYNVRVTEAGTGSATLVHTSTRTSTGHLRWNMTGRATIVVEEENPILKQSDELGLSNPVHTLWELTPYSFVVDWFINVGGWVKGFVPVQGVKYIRGWLSIKTYTRETIHWETRLLSGSPEVINGTVTCWDKTRSLLGGLPEVTLQTPDLSLSYSQVTSGIALLSAGLSGIFSQSESLRI